MSSDFSQHQKFDLIRRFPPLELSYETITHKKVSSPYDICLVIPPGKKYFLWFSFLEKEDVCYLLEIGRDRKIGNIQIIGRNIPVKLALNTLFYGTIWESETGEKYFIIEDMFYYQGIPVKGLPFGEKLGFIDDFFRTYSETLSLSIPLFLPILWKKQEIDQHYPPGTQENYINFPSRNLMIEKGKESEFPEGRGGGKGSGIREADSDDRGVPPKIDDASIAPEWINKIPYPIHHLQYRSLNKISPYLNVPMTRKLSGNPSSIDKSDELLSLMVFEKPPMYDFNKPQYKFPTIFEVKADLQFDIYHLYAFGQKSKREYYGVAYIPNYKVSMFMNGIFRNIRENKNLDSIEESDDEEDFQDMRMDKYVDLKKIMAMECKFHPKFKRWVPLRIANRDEKIIHIGRLIK
jgi:hypothetical protein